MTTVAPAPGEVIGDYEILDRIGGNMGLVFKARHRLLDKVVVLKLVPAECIADPARLTRFQREMRAMGQLEHPNLVTASDARSVGDWHLVAMELIDGVDLHQLVRNRGSLPIAAACEIARQAALGLQYAHEHGLIHRDIKPSNLMLTRAGTLKVIDMGLALIREDSTAQLTQTGLVLGTMSYCAPEQFRDASHVDIRADIYSLGCTLYHLLTGKSPYWQRKTFAEVMQAHLHDPFPSLAEARPDAPAGLEAVLARMTAKEREGRYSTPAEVAKALEPFARGAELAPLVPAKFQQNPTAKATAGKPLPSPQGQSGGGRDHAAKTRWTRRAALIGLPSAIAGGAFLLMNRPKGEIGDSRATTNSSVAQTPGGPPIPIARTNKVIVLMDTNAERGVYDEINKIGGGSNATEVDKVLRDNLPSGTLITHQEKINDSWKREGYVAGLLPDLVIIHRSSFYHPRAAVLKEPYPPFEDPENLEKLALWEKKYEFMGDDKLIDFLGFVGASVPHTQFLVYSRGTDKRWVEPRFRESWVKDIETQYPTLKGRVTPMLINKQPDGKDGTFRDSATQKELIRLVKPLLGLEP